VERFELLSKVVERFVLSIVPLVAGARCLEWLQKATKSGLVLPQVETEMKLVGALIVPLVRVHEVEGTPHEIDFHERRVLTLQAIEKRDIDLFHPSHSACNIIGQLRSYPVSLTDSQLGLFQSKVRGEDVSEGLSIGIAVRRERNIKLLEHEIVVVLYSFLRTLRFAHFN
jgi:hypothetical protein